MWIISDLSVMWRNLKCLHMTDVESSRFIHICHVRNLKIHITDFSPHVSHVNFVTNMRYGFFIIPSFNSPLWNWYYQYAIVALQLKATHKKGTYFLSSQFHYFPMLEHSHVPWYLLCIFVYVLTIVCIFFTFCGLFSVCLTYLLSLCLVGGWMR